jgi:hypothetical protein
VLVITNISLIICAGMDSMYQVMFYNPIPVQLVFKQLTRFEFGKLFQNDKFQIRYIHAQSMRINMDITQKKHTCTFFF